MKSDIDLPGWCFILDKWEEEAKRKNAPRERNQGGDLNE
jgi:hypothetical protein